MPVLEVKRYRLKFFIAIQHSFDGNTEHIHAHTIVIEGSVKSDRYDRMDYRRVEGTMEGCIAKYDNKYLNDMEGFEDSATIERLGEILCFEIDDALKEIGYDMDHFEIGETPLRVYVITDELRD